MSHNDWLIIFENLSVVKKQFLSDEKNISEKSSISIPSIQLELTVTWQKTRSVHADILSLNFNNCFSQYMAVEVKTISKVSEFRSLQESAENNNVHSPVSKSKSHRRVKTRERGDGEREERHEEYVPTTKHVSPSVKYTPMTRALATTEHEHEEYTPSGVSTEDLLIPDDDEANPSGEYRPSHAANNDGHDKPKASPSKRSVMESASKESRSKRNRKVGCGYRDLFGELIDDSGRRERSTHRPSSKEKALNSPSLVTPRKKKATSKPREAEPKHITNEK